MVTIKILLDEKNNTRDASWEISDPSGVEKPIKIRCYNDKPCRERGYEVFIIDFMDGEDVVASFIFEPWEELDKRLSSGNNVVEPVLDTVMKLYDEDTSKDGKIISPLWIIYRMVNEPVQFAECYHRFFSAKPVVDRLIDLDQDAIDNKSPGRILKTTNTPRKYILKAFFNKISSWTK